MRVAIWINLVLLVSAAGAVLATSEDTELDRQTYRKGTGCRGVSVSFKELTLSSELASELQKMARYAMARNRRHLPEEGVSGAMIRQSGVVVVCDAGRLEGAGPKARYVTPSGRCMSGFAGHPKIVAVVDTVIPEEAYTRGQAPVRLFDPTGTTTKIPMTALHSELGQNSAQCWFQASRLKPVKKGGVLGIGARQTGIEFDYETMFLKTDEGVYYPPDVDINGVFRVTFHARRGTHIFAATQSQRVEALAEASRMKGSFDRYIGAAWITQKLLAIGGPTAQYFSGKRNGVLTAEIQCTDGVVEPGSADASSNVEGSHQSAERRPWFIKSTGVAPPFVLAHRGQMSAFSMENSLLQARRTLSSPQSDGIEVDVFLAPDVDRSSSTFNAPSLPEPGSKVKMVPIVSHDNNFMRLLGINKDLVVDLDPKDAHAFRSLMWMTKCDFFKPLSDYLDELLTQPRKVMDIELKPGNPLKKPWKGYAKELGTSVGRLLRSPKYAPLIERDQVVVSSFDSEKTKYVNQGRTNGQGVIRTARAIYKTFAAKALDLLWRRNKEYTTMMLHYSLITPAKVEKYHRAGLSVGVYTLYDATETPDKGFPSRPSASREVIDNIVRSGVDWVETDDVVTCKRELDVAFKGLYGKGDGARASRGADASADQTEWIAAAADDK